MSASSNQPPSRGQFPDTRWTLVVTAKDEETAEGARALAELCELYWSPLYFYVRQRGHSPEAAEDLTQEFFRLLLEKRNLNVAEPCRGRLRSFLIASMKNFLADEWDRSRAMKRGGHMATISIDQVSAEERYRLEPRDQLTPDVLFDRQWAHITLETVMEELRQEHEQSGSLEAFEILQPHLGWNASESPYAKTAQRLGLTENAARLRVLRMRRRYGELLKACIAETVSGEDDLLSEMAYLRRVVATN